MATVLDVLDNFFPLLEKVDFDTIPGTELYRLGEEVRTFASAYQPAHPNHDAYPVYLGGWPSANFWYCTSGELVMSSLLYAGQVLAKDPISDWFCYDDVEKLYSSRWGIYNHDGSLNIAGTRRYLSAVVPRLLELRPLIEAEMLVLVPSRPFLAQQRKTIYQQRDALLPLVVPDPLQFTRQFRPSQIPLADNVRGLYLFHGGEREEQVLKLVSWSLEYLVTEYTLAATHGFNYTAPFEYEQYVCDRITAGRVEPASKNVVTAMLNSSLRLYKGLTPSLVASLRDDPNFGGFRRQLRHTYEHVPTNASESDRAAYIADAEQSLLRPTLEAAEREVAQGLIGKLGAKLTEHGMKIGAVVLAGKLAAPQANFAVLAGLAGIAEAGNLLGEHFAGKKKNDSPTTVWTKLSAHAKTVETEVPRAHKESGDLPASADWWGVPDQNSLKVYTSEGVVLWDAIPEGELPRYDGGYPLHDVYLPCPCGSGSKFKFCCKGLERKEFRRT